MLYYVQDFEVLGVFAMKHNENELAKNQEVVKNQVQERADKTSANYHKEVSQANEDLERDTSDEPEF